MEQDPIVFREKFYPEGRNFSVSMSEDLDIKQHGKDTALKNRQIVVRPSDSKMSIPYIRITIEDDVQHTVHGEYYDSFFDRFHSLWEDVMYIDQTDDATLRALMMGLVSGDLRGEAASWAANTFKRKMLIEKHPKVFQKYFPRRAEFYERLRQKKVMQNTERSTDS